MGTCGYGVTISACLPFSHNRVKIRIRFMITITIKFRLGANRNIYPFCVMQYGGVSECYTGKPARLSVISRTETGNCNEYK